MKALESFIALIEPQLMDVTWKDHCYYYSIGQCTLNPAHIYRYTKDKLYVPVCHIHEKEFWMNPWGKDYEKVL